MSRGRIGLIIVALLAVVGGLLVMRARRWATQPSGWRADKVVLFTVDTLRADGLGLYGFDEVDVSPSLDEWSKGAIVFDRAVSQAPWTVPSLASFLTGRFASEMGVYTNETGIPGGWPTLAEIFQEAGYATASFSSHSLLLEEEMGFRRGFDSVFPESAEIIVGGEHKIPFSDVEPEIGRWLDEHAEESFFIWIHDMDPHSPKTPGNPYFAKSDWHRYDAELRWVDDTFARVVERLEEAGFWDEDVLFVFTADHGEAFGDHGLMGHQDVMYDEVLRVPLMIYYSAMVAPTRITEPVDLLDVRRTILDLAGLSEPPGTFGESLVPLIRGETTKRRRNFSVHSRHYFEDGHHEYAIRDRVWKLLVRTAAGEDRLGQGWPSWTAGRDDARIELYNLVRDPGEHDDVADDHPEVVSYLRDALEDWNKDLADPKREAPRLDDEDMEILRRLGYRPDGDRE